MCVFFQVGLCWTNRSAQHSKWHWLLVWHLSNASATNIFWAVRLFMYLLVYDAVRTTFSAHPIDSQAYKNLDICSFLRACIRKQKYLTSKQAAATQYLFAFRFPRLEKRAHANQHHISDSLSQAKHIFFRLWLRLLVMMYERAHERNCVTF